VNIKYSPDKGPYPTQYSYNESLSQIFPESLDILYGSRAKCAFRKHEKSFIRLRQQHNHRSFLCKQEQHDIIGKELNLYTNLIAKLTISKIPVLSKRPKWVWYFPPLHLTKEADRVSETLHESNIPQIMIGVQHNESTISADLQRDKTNKLRGFSPQPKYSDRATAACRRS
jgi:hypothetical protein